MVTNPSEINEDAIKHATGGTDAVWLSLDSDVMEPAYCPGTGDPESDGLVSRKAIIMVRDVVTQLDLATFGFDVVPQDVRAVSRPDR